MRLILNAPAILAWLAAVQLRDHALTFLATQCSIEPEPESLGTDDIHERTDTGLHTIARGLRFATDATGCFRVIRLPADNLLHLWAAFMESCRQSCVTFECFPSHFPA